MKEVKVLIANATATGGGVGGSILTILFFVWIFGGFEWLGELHTAVVYRLRKGSKGSTKGVKGLRRENEALRLHNNEMERLLLKINVWEKQGVIDLPSEIAEEVDGLVAPPQNSKKKQLPA